MPTTKQQILLTLIRQRIIGGKHTDIINLTKGFPKHERGRIRKTVAQLCHDGILVDKPTHYGLHVSINPERLGEAYTIIEGDTEEGDIL